MRKLFLIFVFLIFCSASFSADAIVAYRSEGGQGVNYPKIKFWNSTGSGNWGPEIELNNSGYNITGIIVRYSPISSRIVIITYSYEHYLDAYICDNQCYLPSSWRFSNNIAYIRSFSPLVYDRPFDLAFESKTGKAILVYAYESTNTSKDLAYKILYASDSDFSNKTEYYLDEVGYSTDVMFNWVDMDANPQEESTEITLMAHDLGSHITAWIWNSTEFTDENEISRPTRNDYEGMAVKYSPDGSKVMVLGTNGKGEGINWTYWNGDEWSKNNYFEVDSGDGNTVEWISLKSIEDSFQAVFVDDGNDLHTGYYNQGSWSITENIDTDIDLNTARPADFFFNRDSDNGYLIWDSDNSRDNLYYIYCEPECTGSINQITSYAETGCWLSTYQNPDQSSENLMLGIRLNDDGSKPFIGSFYFSDDFYNYGDDIITDGESTGYPPSSGTPHQFYDLSFKKSEIKHISQCQALNEPGEYIIYGNLTGYLNYSGTLACLYINSSNIDINGDWHIIDGNDTSSTYGIFANAKNNVTIRIVNITDYTDGIHVSNMTNLTLYYILSNSNTLYGIWIESSNFSNLTQIIANNNNMGIRLRYSLNNIISNAISNENVYGVYLDYSNNTIATNVQMHNNSNTGYVLESYSINNTLMNSISQNNSVRGVLFTISSSENKLINVSMIKNAGRGALIQSSSHNNLIENCTISHTTGTGYGLDLSTNGNNITGTVFFNNSARQLSIGGNSNLIYNNIFNATGSQNLITTSMTGLTFYWNITKTLQTNIIGKPYIGGNWYSNYTGKDNTGDYLGDTIYYIDQNNIDYYPLVENTTAITSCTNITSSGEYYLGSNINGQQPGYGKCIDIQVENVLLELNGFKLNSGIPGNAYTGIYVNGTEFKESSNITIQNGYLQDYATGIMLASLDSYLVKNISVNSSIYGIYAYGSKNGNITMNNINLSENYGILLSAGSNNNLISNNVLPRYNDYSIYLATSHNNTISENKINLSDWNGISLVYSHNNTIENNTIDGSLYYGIWVSSSQNNFFNNNSFNSNLYGIFISNSNNTKYSNSLINNTNRNALSIYNSINDTYYNFVLDNSSTASIAMRSSKNNIIYNITSYGAGIYFNPSNNLTVENITITNADSNGLDLNQTTNSTFRNFYIINASNGISAYTNSKNNTLINFTVLNSRQFGVLLNSSSNYNKFSNFTIFNSSSIQLMVDSSSENLFYNNIFNATGSQGVISLFSPEQPNPLNYWNITKTLQTNIIGKPYVAGNWYSNYNGLDLTGDYLGDTSYYIGTGGNYDHAPLTYETNSISECMNITKSGYYVLTMNLEKNQSSGKCIDIQINNVFINLSGYSITGISPVTTNTYAVYGVNLNNISVFSGSINKYYIGIYFSNVSNSTIYNISISNIGNSGSGIYIISSTQANVSNCNLTNNDRHGIFFSSINNSVLSNNFAENNTWHGFYLISSSKINLTNNTGIKNSLRGFYFDSVSNLSLVNNNASFNGREGFYFPSSSYENNIINNTVHGNGYSGIYLFEGNSNTISKNYFNSNNISGIYIMSNSNNNNITFNIANNNTKYGIEVYSCSGNMLYENTAHDNTNGILMNSSSNNTLIENTANYNSENGIYYYSSSDNDLINSTANYNSNIGILFWSDSYFSKIENATVLNNSVGLRLDQSNRNNVSIIYSSGNSNYGISITRSSNNTLSNITSFSNSYGVLIERTYDVNLSNSLFYENSISQIYLNDAKNNLIFNNIFNATTGNIATISDANSNYWNITKTLQTNIIGKPYIGGNWYSNYTGLDISGDYLGDVNYYVDENNVDYYPLTDSINRTILLCQNITSAGQYSLTANLSGNQSSGACIHVLANNTEIDLNWNTIKGSNQTDSYGIQIMPNIINTTIKNGYIEYYSKNIYLTLNNNQTTMQDLNLSITNNSAYYSLHIHNNSMDYIINKVNFTCPNYNSGPRHIYVSGSRGTINQAFFRYANYGAYFEGNSTNLGGTILNNSIFSGTAIYTNLIDNNNRMLIENTAFGSGGTAVSNRLTGVNIYNCEINRTINYGGAIGNYNITNSRIYGGGSPWAYTGGNNVYWVNNTGSISYFFLAYAHNNFYFINNNFSITAFGAANCGIYVSSWARYYNNTFTNSSTLATYVGECGTGVQFIDNQIIGGYLLIRGNNTVIANNYIVGNLKQTQNGITLGTVSEPAYRNTSANAQIYNNTVLNFNGTGILIRNAKNLTMYNNIIKNNLVSQGVFLNVSSSLIYNNFFSTNTSAPIINATDILWANNWNTTKTLQTNIINGSHIGGNYYSNYTGWDTDGDGIGELSYILNGNNIDYYPLTYNIDTIPPSISFVFPTPEDNSNVTGNWLNINVTANDTNLSNIILYIYNYTGSLVNSTTCYSSPCYYNFTNLEYGTYYINASAFDLANWSNYTETREINLTKEIKSWHIFYGKVYSSNIALSSETFFNWNETLNGYIYATSEGSNIDFNALYALGTSKSGGIASNDFSELDYTLSMSGAPDSITNLFSSEGTHPFQTQNITFMRNNIKNVPFANSSSTQNQTSFITGILWDSSDDKNGEYDSLENEDIIFITFINNSKQGGYGTYDYEIRVPGTFDTYSSGSQITLWMELK